LLGSHNDLDCHHSIHQPLKSLLLQRFQGVNGYQISAVRLQNGPLWRSQWNVSSLCRVSPASNAAEV
jgi:hypothetical protein